MRHQNPDGEGPPATGGLSFSHFLRKSIAQADGAVEHRPAGRSVGAAHEIAMTSDELRSSAAGSTLASVNTSSDCGLMSAAKLAASGDGVLNSWLYRRSSAGTECCADSQCMVALTLRPSGALPPLVAGS